MARGSATYTTYLRTELDAQTRQSYSQLRAIADATYKSIAVSAAQATAATGAAFDNRRAATGLRSLEVSATGAFANIRREAASTSSAVAAMQARLSTIRTTSITGNGIGGIGNGSVAIARAAAVANDNLAASNRRVTSSAIASEAASRRQVRSLADVSAQTTRLSRGLEVAGATLAVAQGPLGPLAGRVSAVSAAVNTLGTGTLVLAGAATALFAFAGVANVYAQVESRLKPLYDTQQQVNGALRETGRIALATRTALGPTADLYAKLTSAGRDYNLTSVQVSRITETANKAATLSGGATASREAGLYQFSQGLSSGKLGGDELRSVLENIPELARAIAQGFKNADGSIGTTIGNLRKLGAEGALTTGVVVDALERSADIIDAKFSKLPATIGSANTQFATTFTLMIGKIDQATGVTSTLANLILVAAQNLRTLIALGGAIGAAFVLPKLTAFITDLRTAAGLQRELAAQSKRAIDAGTASPVSFTPAGRAFNTARGEQAAAAGAASNAQQRVLDEKQIVTAIDAEIAKTRQAQEADREKARAASANARFEVAASTLRTEALQREFAQIEANRIALQSNVDSFSRSRPFVQRQQPGETSATRANIVSEFDKAESAAKLELAQANLRAGAASRALTEAKAAEAGATAVATEATLSNTAAANASASRGLAQLGLAQQRAVAQAALTAAEVEARIASEALTAASVRSGVAQRALAAASGFATAAMTSLRAGAASVVSFFGGPFNLAMTAAIGLFIYLAGQSNAALDALNNFSGGQEELQRRLGITTDKLREQSDAARELAAALVDANVEKARNARTDANADLAKSLTQVAGRIYDPLAGKGGDQASATSSQILSIADRLRNGQSLTPEGIRFVAQLQKSNPDAFKAGSGFFGSIRNGAFGLAGGRPDQTADKLLGTEASRLTLEDALKRQAETRAALAKPRTPIVAEKPLTQAQIIAQATARANAIDDPRKAAEDKRKDGLDRIAKQKDLTDAERIEKSSEVIETYNKEIAAIGKRNAALERKEARAAQAEHRKELRAEEAAANAAAAATEKLADIRARYDQAPKLADRVANDQRAIQALVGSEVNVTDPSGKVVGRRKFTQQEADQDSARAQDALLKPFRDMTQEYERQANIQSLILQGREDEAEALGRAYQLLDSTGVLQEGQFADLVRAAGVQRQINDALADRERIVSTLSGAVDDVRQTAVQFLNELPNNATRAGGNALKGLLDGFSQRSNQLLIDRLLGGTQKRIDDLISGKTALQNATTFTAQQATRTGGIVRKFGDTIETVIARVDGVLAGVNSGNAAAGVSGNPFAGDFANKPIVDSGALGASITAGLTASIGALLSGGNPSGGVTTAANGTTDDGVNIIVGAARRVARTSERVNRPAAAQQPSGPVTLREVYNETGRSIGEKLDKALGTKFAAGVGAKLGDALQGAGRGSFASSIAEAVGIKQSKTGAQIGGAIGSFVPIPFGAEIGGVIGGTIGGLFKKSKQASASISFDANSGQLVGNTAVGRGRDEKAQATALGGALADRVNAIAEALGGTVTGAGSVSIGYRPGHKDPAYRVDTSGKGKLTGVLAFATEEEAIAAAVKDLVGDGVIGGISQASQRILRSGQDLAKALDKALLIESVPKRLLQLQDPVRAAVNDLNTEFTKIIAALNEGGATAEQYAQAQQLYDLERARSIKEAQTAASTAISDYLKEINATTASPLNKGTVYANALANFNTTTADKAATPEDLVAASKALYDASRALKGSGEGFFSDFDRINSTLTAAQIAAGQLNSNGDSTLPSSPFSSQAVQDAIGRTSAAQVGAINQQTQVLVDRLDTIIANGGISSPYYTSGGGTYSSISNLAAFRDQ